MSKTSKAARAFRDALGQFATGVTVVTTVKADGAPVGITVNSFTSLSLTPPLVLWNLSRNSANWEAFQDAEHFAINVLAADQEPLALAFAIPGGDPFAGLQVEKGEGGVPLLPGTLAQFECELRHRYPGGDHEMLIGEVVDYCEFEGEPLMMGWALNIYDKVLGPILLILGFAILLGVATRTSLFLLGLLYVSLTWGLVMIGQDPGVAWLGTHMVLIAMALMLADHNRFAILKKW